MKKLAGFIAGGGVALSVFSFAPMIANAEAFSSPSSQVQITTTASNGHLTVTITTPHHTVTFDPPMAT